MEDREMCAGDESGGIQRRQGGDVWLSTSKIIAGGTNSNLLADPGP